MSPRLPRSAVLLVVLAVLLCAPLCVWAQDAVQARALEEKARAALKEKRFEEARDLLFQAIAIAPEEDAYRYRGKAGLVLQELKQLPEAWFYCSAYVRYFEARPGTPEQVRQGLETMRRQIEDLEGQLADTYVRVRITSDPPGAMASVPPEDAVHTFPTPADWWFLPGQYKVRVRLQDYYTYEDTLTVTFGGEASCHVVLTLKKELMEARLAEVEARDASPTVSPQDKQRAWEAFAAGPARMYRQEKEMALDKARRWREQGEFIADRNARLAELRQMDADAVVLPAGKADAWREFSEKWTGEGDEFRALAEERVAYWTGEQQRLLLEELNRRWLVVRARADEDEWSPALHDELVALLALAPEGWVHRAEAERLLRARQEIAAARRYLPGLALGWGPLPPGVWLEDPFFAFSHPFLRQARPDLMGRVYTRWRLTLSGMHAQDAVLPHAGEDGPRSISTPVPVSPTYEHAFFEGGDATSEVVFRGGVVPSWPLSSPAFESIRLSDDVSVALDGGLDWWAASNPEEKDWGAGLFAASATFSPLDWMNPTFPYPGGIFRTSAQVTWRLGDARGYFDFLFGASAFYRSMAVGSLPNTLFADENVVANPEHPAEERRKAFSAGLSPHLGLVVRPSQRLQLSARWMPFLAGSEWSPTRSYDGMFYQNVSGAAEVLLFRDVLGEQRVLLAGEVGVIATWAPVGDGDNPQYDILTGRLIASYERPGLVAHAGIQNLFDPTSFFGDYMNLWALGLGGRGTFELGPPDMMGHRVGFGVDALYAPPLWTRNQQEQVERVGFARIGDDSSTDASRMTFAELSARGEVWLWRGLLLGLSYKYRYSWADLGIEGPDGQTFTMAVEPAGTHVVLYYLGWEGGE